LYYTGKHLLLPDHMLSPVASLASDKLIPSVKKLVEMINKYFFNIVEHNRMQNIQF
jgi:hypothetical protein